MLVRTLSMFTAEELQFLDDMIPEPELTDQDLEALCRQQDSDIFNEYMEVELALQFGG